MWGNNEVNNKDSRTSNKNYYALENKFGKYRENKLYKLTDTRQKNYLCDFAFYCSVV